MENEKKSITLMIGWMLLFLVGLLMSLGALESAFVAFRGTGDALATVRIDELSRINPGIPDAVRGRRLTACGYALSCGLLICWISATAYRRREKWAYYGLLASVGLGSILSIARLVFVGSIPGAGAPGLTLAVLVVALAISYRDFR